MGETQSKSASPSGWSASYDVEGPSSSRLIEACQRGQAELVSKLLRRGKKINKVDERGDTALHKAAAYGFTEIVQMLLKKNSELANVENVDGLTAFHLAAQYGKIECARIILEACPKLVNSPFAKNPANFDYSFIERSGKIVWNVNNFSRIEEKKVFSDVFQLGGYKWRLVLYPRGSKGDDNLSLYLEVANHEKLPEGWSYLAGFTFGIVNQLTGVAKIVREVPAHRFYRSHTDLGFPQMVKKSTLYNRKFGIIVRDRLQVALCLKTLDASSFGLEESCGTYSCRLNGFSKSKDSRMISNTFYVAGVPWNLAVYPKGKQVSQTLSVYLKVVPPAIQPHYTPQPTQATAQSQRETPIGAEESPNETHAMPIAVPSSLTSPSSISFAQASSSATPTGLTAPIDPILASSPTPIDPNAWYYGVNFRISLVNLLDGTKFTRSVDAKVFKHKCEDWGFPQFIKLATLLNPESGFVNDDSILLEVSMEVVDCLRPSSATSTRHLICTLPSTPSYGKPMSPLGLHTPPQQLFPTSLASSSTLVQLSSQGVSSFSTPLRKPFTSKGYKHGIDWHINTPIKYLAFTPLHWAVYCGNLEAISELLSKQADIEACDANGRTPLDWACYLGQYDTVKLLVAQNASAKVRDAENAKPIHKATYIGSPDVIQAMLHHLDNLETDLVPLDRRRKASVGSEAEAALLSSSSRLAAADVSSGLSPVPEGFAMDHGASSPVIMPPSPRDFHGQPGLSPPNSFRASTTAASSNPTVPSSSSSSPSSNMVVASSTAARDSSPSHRLVLTSSSHSRGGNSTDLESELDGLTTSQQDISTGSDDGVVSSMKTEVGGILASSVSTNQSKSNPTNAATNDKSTTYSAGNAAAASHRRHSSGDSAGSSGNPTSTSTPAPPSLPLAVHTPLQLCLRSQKSALTEQLVEDFDGNINCVDEWGRTPLHMVAYLGDINLLELFLSRCHPQLVNHQDKDGFTPLHKAISKGYFDCVQVLLNAGADVGLRSKSGYTPFHYAVLTNELQCAKMILEFDRRRGTAPIPLRDLDAARRGSDVVESDIPLPTEKKKATVSISDTIQLLRPDMTAPAATERNALHRSADRLPLGILHHPPGSDAAIARQLQQLKRMRGTSSDEEPFETRDSVPSVEATSSGSTATGGGAASDANRKSRRRRSVNFHGDNSVVRIKHSNAGNSDDIVQDEIDLSSATQGRLSTVSPPRGGPRKFSTAEDLDEHVMVDSDGGGDQQGLHSDGEESSASLPNNKLVDDSALSADSGDDVGDQEDRHSLGERQQTSRKRSNTTGNVGRFGSRRLLSDDDEDDDPPLIFGSTSHRRMAVDEMDAPADINADEMDASAYDSPEESSESLSTAANWKPSSGMSSSSMERSFRETRGRPRIRRGLSTPNAALDDAEQSEWAFRDVDGLASISFGERDPNNQTHTSSTVDTARSTNRTTRRTHFSKNRSRSTDTFRTEGLISAKPSPPTPSQQSATTSSGELPKRSSKLSGILRAFSGGFKGSEVVSPASPAPSQSIPLPQSQTQHTYSMDSEGAQLRRGKVRRSSSSSSLESHAIVPHHRQLQTQRAAISPPSSPPTSPTQPPRSTKLTQSSNASVSSAIGALNSSSSTSTTTTSATGTSSTKSRKSRSPPPAGRRPKSGSISTAERDALTSVISPRTNSPRHLLSHSSGANVVNFGADPRNTSSVSPPPQNDDSSDETAPITTPSSNATSTTSGNISSARVHTKSPSDGATIEGKSSELHRSASGPSSEKLPHFEKLSSSSVASGGSPGPSSSSDKPGSTERIPKDDPSSSSPASSTAAALTSSQSTTPSTSVVSTKKRSKSGRSTKSDLKIQVNASTLSSPASPSNISSASLKELASIASGSSGSGGNGASASSPRAGHVAFLPPCYAPQEILRMSDANGWLPLHTSVKQGNLQMTQYLLAKGASVLDLANGMSVLDLAIQNQDATLTKLLLQSESPLSDVGPSLQTFLSQKIFAIKGVAEVSPPIPPSTFVGDLRALLNNAQFFDVTFTIEGKQMYGWKGLLATRCEVFRAMFTGALREANESHIVITDVSYSTFYHIIEFIYTDSVSAEKMTLDDALQLLAAANRYILDRLKRIIERWLLSQLSEHNVAMILHAADLYQAPYLRSACLLYVANHLHRIPNLHDLLNGSFRGVLLDFLNSPQQQ